MDGSLVAQKLSGHVIATVIRNVAGQLVRGDGGSEARVKHSSELLKLLDVLFERGQGHLTFQELERADLNAATAIFVGLIQALKLGADLPQDEWGAQQSETHVDLLYSGATGLIIAAPTKVFYSNQVGGHATQHPSLEGYFVPLGLSVKTLKEYFTGPKWKGWCQSGIDEETARFIESVVEDDLKMSFSTRFFSVDRTALSKSCEAWVYVRLDSDARNSIITTEEPRFGVLTWLNSD